MAAADTIWVVKDAHEQARAARRRAPSAGRLDDAPGPRALDALRRGLRVGGPATTGHVVRVGARDRRFVRRPRGQRARAGRSWRGIACTSPAATTRPWSCSIRTLQPTATRSASGSTRTRWSPTSARVGHRARRRHAHPDPLPLKQSCERAGRERARFWFCGSPAEPEELEQRRQRALDRVDRDHQLVGDLRDWRRAPRTPVSRSGRQSTIEHPPLRGRQRARSRRARAARVGAAVEGPCGALTSRSASRRPSRRHRRAAGAGRARVRR